MSEQNIRVLIVDDEESFRKPLVERLQRLYNFQVDDAENGNKALHLLDTRGRYDVVLIDQVLEGGIDGLELLKRVKSGYPSTQVIVFTGWPDKMQEQGVNVLRQGAYRYFAKPFNLEELALTIRFAAEEIQTRQERQYMAALVKVGQGLTQTTQQDEQLRLAWDFVREQLEVSTFFIGLNTSDKKSIYFPLFYDEGQLKHLEDRILGKRRLEWGLAGYVVKTGEEVRWSTAEEMKQLRKAKKITPILVGKPSASGFCVPLQMGRQIQGVISAQSYQPHVFTLVLQNALRALGSQLSVALENSRLFAEAEQTTIDIEHKANSLSTLQELALTINSSLKLDEILTKACQTAVEFFHADHSGLVLFDHDFIQGTVEAEYPDLIVTGKKIPLRGIPAEEKLIKTRKPLAVYDVRSEESLGVVRDILLELNVRSILFVPVIGKEGIIGSFSLDAINQQRHFSADEISLCKTFADQVAVAIENARLFDEIKQWADQNEDKLMRLEKLAKVTKEITGNLGSMTLDELLTLIAKHATDILDAEVCGIHLVKRDGFLSLEASYGHRKGGFKKGKEFAIRSGPKTGLTGHIAYEGKLFNAHGDELANHIAVRGVEPDHLPSGKCYSLLAIPLKKQVGDTEKLVGLLRAENKKKNGYALPTLSFTKEDEWILNIFAEAVVVAIESAELVGQLNEKKDHLARLIASSPEGIIAIDRQGNVTGFNERAQEILGYTADEVLGKPVDPLYFDPQAPHEIGRLLRAAPDGKLSKYETFVRAKTRKGEEQGERIPIRLSVTWLYDSEGKHIGSVGYFEDLRTIKETERRLELLLKASHALAQAENLTDGLQRLAEMMVSLLIHTFCRILLLDESGEFLVVKAAYPIPRSGERPNWDLGLGKHTAVSEWRGLRKLLETGSPRVVKWSDEQARPVLVRYSRWLGSEKDIQSLLMVPLNIGNRVVGLLEVGEAREEERARFSDAEVELASAIAAETTISIDRMRLNEITERRKMELEHLHTAAQAMTSTVGTRETLKQIANSARDVLEADYSLIWSYDHSRDIFKPEELAVSKNVPIEWVERFGSEPAAGQTTRQVLEKEYVSVTDLSKVDWIGESTQQSLEALGVQSFQGIRLDVEGIPLGVLYVDYKVRRDFGAEERQVLEHFSHDAALTLKRARLDEQVQRSRYAARAVAEVNALGKLEDTLKAIVKGAREALHCDIATVYTFDEKSNSFIYAEGEGYIDRNNMRPPREVKEDSPLWRIIYLKDNDYHISEDALNDELLRGSFVHKEGIKSALGMRLHFGDQCVGVMFINYCAPHRFLEDEIRDALQFNHQAAVAIRNAQLFEEQNRARTASRVVAELAVLGDLNKTLESIVSGAKEVLRCDVATLYTYDEETDEFSSPPAMAGIDEKTKVLMLGEVAKHSVVQKILELEKTYEAEDASSDLIMRGSFVSREKIKSSVGIPLRVGDRRVGVMFVNYRSHHRFTADESANIELFANQAAVAIRNAQLYQTNQQYTKTLVAIQETSSAVSAAILELDILFPMITDKAAEIFNAPATSLMMWDKSNDNLIIRAACGLSDEFRQGQQIARSVVDKIVAKRGLGPHVININQEPIGDPKLVKSERLYTVLVAPFAIGNELIGVLNIYSKYKPRQFKETEEELATIFANHATIAIQNARSYNELKHTKGLVGARTALAWTGMVSSTWRHTIEKHAITIREQVELLRGDLESLRESESIKKRLAMMERLANQILEKPFTAPLTAEEGGSSVSVNDFLKERVHQLWAHQPYKDVVLESHLRLANSATIRTSIEWLRRAIDILIDNAVDATEGLSERKIVISSGKAYSRAEISIRDNGRGIPAEVQERLFREPIAKLREAKGLGMGLLFAQMIIQTYGGEIRVGETGANGTTMIMSLPLET